MIHWNLIDYNSSLPSLSIHIAHRSLQRSKVGPMRTMTMMMTMMTRLVRLSTFLLQGFSREFGLLQAWNGWNWCCLTRGSVLKLGNPNNWFSWIPTILCTQKNAVALTLLSTILNFPSSSPIFQCQIRRDEPVDTGSMGAVISFGLIFLGTLCSTVEIFHLKLFFWNGLVGNLESTSMAATIEVPPAPNIHSFQFLCNPAIQSWRCQTSSLLQKRVVGTMTFCRGRYYTRMFYVVSRYTDIPIKCTKNHPVNRHQSILFISAYEADSFHWCMFVIVTLLLFTRPFHWVETEGHRISRLPGHGIGNMISWWALLTF